MEKISVAVSVIISNLANPLVCITLVALVAIGANYAIVRSLNNSKNRKR
jgi:hypothetical protein